jgi:hypothetical protein
MRLALLLSGLIPAIAFGGADPSQLYSSGPEYGAQDRVRISLDPARDRVPVEASLRGSHTITNAGELFAEPEKTVALQVSNRDVNRINCPGSVTDVFFSQEKNVTVTPGGNDIYVKFLVQQRGQERAYITDPADLHVVCDGSVYTMILHPRPIDSVTIRLGRQPVGVEQVAREWSALPLEDRVKRLTLAIWHNDLPPGFSRTRGSPTARSTRLYNDLAIEPIYTLRGPGSGLRATEYSVKALRPVSMEERYFLRPEFGDVIAITLDPLVLYREGDRSRLIVVERVVSDGQ